MPHTKGLSLRSIDPSYATIQQAYCRIKDCLPVPNCFWLIVLYSSAYKAFDLPSNSTPWFNPTGSHTGACCYNNMESLFIIHADFISPLCEPAIYGLRLIDDGENIPCPFNGIMPYLLNNCTNINLFARIRFSFLRTENLINKNDYFAASIFPRLYASCINFSFNRISPASMALP